VLFAAVRQDGTVVSGQVSVVHVGLGTGDYEVIFPQSIFNGVAVATPETFPGGGSATAGAAAQITIGFGGIANEMQVSWTAPSGPVDTSFGLIVAL
jgi:hypothetical protein